MFLRVNLIVIISLSFVIFAFSKNPENVSESMSETNVDSNCTDYAPPVLSKGQKWIATEKNLKKLISSVSKSFVRSFDSEDISKISPKCFSSLLKIAVGLKQLKMWAFRFLDTMGKIPDGMGRGTLSALGDFDGCLDINVTGNFQGKSCILEVTPPLPKVLPRIGIVEDVPELETHFSPDTIIGSISSLLKPQYELMVIRIALCVPSTCSQDDVKFMVDKALETTNIFVGLDAKVAECQVKEDFKIEGWNDYASVIVIGSLIMMVIIGTLTEITMTRLSESNEETQKRGDFFRILLCFSMYRNTENLLKHNESTDAVSIFNGIRVVSILWVILCHTYSFVPHQIVFGAIFARDVTKSYVFQVVSNGYPGVQTFFFVGGTLLMYNWMKSKEQNMQVFKYIFKRYWRLAPAMMLVIAFEMLVYRAGSGPVWKMIYGEWNTNCRERWWMNLIFINNFYDHDKMCAPWMWYVAVDMQLYIISFIVLATIKKHPKISLSILVVLIVSSIAVIVCNHYYYGVPPLMTTNMPTIGDAHYFVKYNYYRPHVHAIVYFIGLAVGYALHHKSRIRISRKVNIIGWLASFTAGISVLYSGYIWYNVDPDPPTAVAATYTVASKVLWSSALGWVTISCCTGNAGFITRLLSWSAFTPLAKLTYVTYLVAPVIQRAYYTSSRLPFEMNHRTLVFLYLSFVMASFIVAYFLSMLFEAPFMQLEKIIFYKEKKSSNTSQDTEKNGLNHNGTKDYIIDNQVKNLSLNHK